MVVDLYVAESSFTWTGDCEFAREFDQYLGSSMEWLRAESMDTTPVTERSLSCVHYALRDGIYEVKISNDGRDGIVRVLLCR